MSVENKQIRGDASVSRNVNAGGNARVQGNMHVGHNLRVDGAVEARNVKAANKGLFLDEAQLKARYPQPEEGWFAGVGSSSPFVVYIARNGEWQRTTGTFSVDVDMDSYNQRIDELESQVAELIEIILSGGGGNVVNVRVSVEGHGSVTGSGLYQIGNPVTLTATAESGYHFVEWQDADGVQVSTEPTYTFDATESVTMKAVFAVTRLEISVVSNNNYLGRVSITEPDADGKYTPGTPLTLTATANDTNPLAYFHKWSDGDTDSQRNITASEDKVYQALFYERQLISIGTSEGGTVEVRVNGEVRTGSVYVKRGDVVELTAIGTTNEPSAWQDNEGNEMSGTTFDPTEHKRKYQFTYTGEQSLTFTPVFGGDPITVKYTVELTMEPSGAGSVEILIGSDDSGVTRGEFEDGTTIMLTATKNEGWQLARWEKGSSQMEAEWDDEKGRYILSITVSQATAGNYKAVFEHAGEPDFYFGAVNTPNVGEYAADYTGLSSMLASGYLVDNNKAIISGITFGKTFIYLYDAEKVTPTRVRVIPVGYEQYASNFTGEEIFDTATFHIKNNVVINGTTYTAIELLNGNESEGSEMRAEITFTANNNSQE